jgi:hypothetical protein
MVTVNTYRSISEVRKLQAPYLKKIEKCNKNYNILKKWLVAELFKVFSTTKFYAPASLAPETVLEVL